MIRIQSIDSFGHTVPENESKAENAKPWTTPDLESNDDVNFVFKNQIAAELSSPTFVDYYILYSGESSLEILE